MESNVTMFKNLNITTKVVIAIFLVVVVSTFVNTYIIVKVAERYLEVTRITSLENIADFKVDKIETFFHERRGDIAVAQGYFNIKTNLPIVTQFARDRKNPAYITAKKALDSQLKIFQRVYGYIDVMLVNPEGLIVYVSEDTHLNIDMGLHISDVNVRALEEGEKGIWFSEIYKSEIQKNKYKMLITAPVKDFDGRFIGLIVIQVDANTLYEFILETTGLGETGEALIGKDMGDAALFLNTLRHDKESVLNKKVLYSEKEAFPMREAVQGRNGSGLSIDYRGREVVAAWRYLPSVDCGLVVKIDTDEAFLLIYKLRKYAFLCTFCIIFIAMFTGYLFFRTVTTSLKKLIKTARRIAAGEFDLRTDIQSQDEVGLLAGSFNMMTDSLQKEIEKKRVSEECFRELVENINEVFWICDPELTRMIYISRQYESMWGRTCESLYNDPMSFMEGIHPDDRELVRNAVSKWCEEPYNIQYRILHSDGTIFWVWARAFQVKDESGQTKYMAGIAEDITRRKKLEDKLKGKIRELQVARESIVRAERLATVGRFAGTIAHDVRHPLTIIRNSSYFLNMTLKDADEKTRKHLKLIDREVSFANSIITQLLTFSRAKEPECIKTNINDFISDYMSEYLLPDGIKVVTEFDNKCHEIMVDRTQFKQLFDNLTVNAIDAMSEGGRLTITTRYLSSVNSHLEKEKPMTDDQEPMTKCDFVEITFEDTGSGIKKEDLKKILEPLFTTKQQGTGLGLSIVKNIVEVHGGKISVESEEGKGSKFTIVFPGSR